MNYKDNTLTHQIPKAARIQRILKKGEAKFIDIDVRISPQITLRNETIQVISSNKIKNVAFVVQKKNYDGFFDCFDNNNNCIKDIFICKICHDSFSSAGGNVARHATQHIDNVRQQREQLLRDIRIFIYQTAQPFSIIENETFRNLFTFKLISVDYLLKLMKEDFNKLLKGIQIEIDKASYAALVLDEWSSNNNSFIGVTTYLSGSEVQFDSIVLALSIPNEFDRTASTISKELLNQLGKFNFRNKIIGSVTDCAAVMKKAIENSNIKWSPCLSHIVHNAVKRMLNSISDFGIAMHHANELALDYRFKQYLSVHLKKKQNIQTFNDTRWLSRFKTCNDIVELYSTMKHYEATLNKLIKIKNEDNKIITENYVCPITNQDYIICISLHDSLLKLSELILKFEKRSHDNYFYALFWLVTYTNNLKNELESNGLSDCFNIFESYIIQKLKKYSNLAELLGVGALLNPNLKIEDLINNNSIFYFIIDIGLKKIKTTIDSYNLNNQGEENGELGKRKKKKLNEYSKWIEVVDPIEEVNDECVYQYWLRNDLFPKLKDLALRVSAIPTSSSDCERLFSMAKYVVGPNRNSMTKENIEMSTILYANYQLTKLYI